MPDKRQAQPENVAIRSTHHDINTIVNGAMASDAPLRVQALRELKSLLTENYPLDNLPSSTRVILARSISSYPISAKLASQSLLNIISNSSPITLKQQCPDIIHPIISAFTSATQTLYSLQRKDHLVKTTYLLRILSTMIFKVGSPALLSLSDQIDGIQRCYQPIPSSLSLKQPDRIVLSSQPTQTLTTTIPRAPPRYSDSDASSEGEGFSHPSATPQAVQCRLDAMNCLRAIAEADPKSLYSFWPRLLPAFEYRNHHPYTLMNVIEQDCQLVVRLRTCSVMQRLLQDSGSYMAIAEENTSRVSFISLSAQLASITVELHRRLGRLLMAPPVASELTKEVLKICETISKVSAYHRIPTPILNLLVNPIVGLLTSIDFNIKNQAKITLRVIFQHLPTISKTITLQISPLVDRSALIACDHLLSKSKEILIPSWCDLIQSTLPLLVWNEPLIEKFLQLQNIFEPISVNEEEARKKLSLLGSLTLFFPGESFDAIYVRWVRVRLRDDGLDSLDLVVNGKCPRILTYIVNNLQFDLQNAWVDLRAMRLIGIIVSKSCAHHSTELATQMVFNLSLYYDNDPSNSPDEKVVSTHTWAMANCLESIKDFDNGQPSNGPIDLGFWLRILRILQRLLADRCPSSSLQTNCARIIGITVPKIILARELDCAQAQGAIDEIMTKCFDFLDVALPKVQWNIATALRQILSVLVDGPSHTDYFSQLADRICEKLNHSLERSSSYKVRIQVCLALQVVKDKLPVHLLQSITKSKEVLDNQFSQKQVPNKEMEHARRLQLETEKLLQSVKQITHYSQEM